MAGMLFRKFNTNVQGGQWDGQTILAVWNKATIVPGVNAAVRRKDACGAWIDWDKYGNTVHHSNGWEIDHIKPVASGGADIIPNLQPLQWQNNRTKGDMWPGNNYCSVRAS